MITFKEYLAEIAIKGKAVKKKDFEDLEVSDVIKISIDTRDQTYKRLENKMLSVIAIGDDRIRLIVPTHSDPSHTYIIKFKDKWYIGTYEVKLKEIL